MVDFNGRTFPVAHPLSVPSPSCSKGAIHVAKVPRPGTMRGWIGLEMASSGYSKCTPGVVGRCGILRFFFMTLSGKVFENSTFYLLQDDHMHVYMYIVK